MTSGDAFIIFCETHLSGCEPYFRGLGSGTDSVREALGFLEFPLSFNVDDGQRP